MKSQVYFHLDRSAGGWADSVTVRLIEGEGGELVRHVKRAARGRIEERVDQGGDVDQGEARAAIGTKRP